MSSGVGDRLALNGGTPVRTKPLLPGYPGGLLIGQEEKAAVMEVLDFPPSPDGTFKLPASLACLKD